jgi:hydrogenase-1 operon protein HyaF
MPLAEADLMSGLDKITVVTENPLDFLSGNVPPLLYEISHALEQLLAHGTSTLIDLNTLPLTPADAQLLHATLGQGEVTVRLNINGSDSHIWETACAGVWQVQHYHTEGTLLSQHLEICHVPSIVMAQNEDIQAGLNNLMTRIKNK